MYIINFFLYFQTFELAGHLLYWGKATVIYPVCENNVYIISPKIGDVLTPVVMERFADKFPGENFVSMLSMFNNPTSISHRQHFHNPGFVQLLGRIHRLLSSTTLDRSNPYLCHTQGQLGMLHDSRGPRPEKVRASMVRGSAFGRRFRR